MNIATLRKKAHDGSLEVEDLLQAAIEKQPGLSDELPRLADAHGWQSQGLRSDGTSVVPFAKWAAVASAYALEEFAGLHALAKEPENIPFLLGLVEEIKTNDAVAFVLSICSQHLTDSAQSKVQAFRVASAFNSLLSFKQAAPVTTAQAKSIQHFLFALYPHAKTEVNRATVLLALRGVGDHNAIQFLESVLDFGEPWADTKKSVLRAIRKRIKTNVL